MNKTFTLHSFGCRVNQAEIQEINRQLSAVSFQYSEKNPSFYIINTCAVTAKAEREARQFINQIKKKFPQTKVVVTGCAATKWKKNKMKINNADWLIENKEKKNIAQFFIKRSKIKPQKSKPSAKRKNKKDLNFELGFALCPPASEAGTLNFALSKYLSSKRLLVKIQDGCNRFCTYCIVPYLRGKPKSKKIKEIVKEVKEVEKQTQNLRNVILKRQLALKDPAGFFGFQPQNDNPQTIKEVILTAINTEAFGVDTGENFIDLIKAIIKETKIPRISFGSINPWSIDEQFFALYRELITDNRLVHFFHIPLQSGSSKILSLMKRDYTQEEFREKIETLVGINPFALIATDVIVGFLDETEEDFKETYNFLKDSPISKFHVFRFSKREGTAAFYMAKKLRESSEQTKKKRAKILRELGKEKYNKFLQEHTGHTFPTLFLDKRTEDLQEGLLNNQIPVLVKINKNLAGEIKEVKIECLKDGRLLGKLS